MNILRISVLALISFSASMPSSATDTTQSFVAAQMTFEASLAGDKKATEPAIKSFSALVKQEPDHPLFLAYLGSSYTMRARDAWMPWKRLRNAEKGLEMIDKALLLLEPKHDQVRLRNSIVSMETRLVAVSTFLQVPGFLNRLQPAKDLLKQTLESPVFESAAPEVKGRLYLWAADIAEREAQIKLQRDYLEKSLNLLPPSRFRDQAEQQLAGLDQ